MLVFSPFDKATEGERINRFHYSSDMILFLISSRVNKSNSALLRKEDVTENLSGKTLLLLEILYIIGGKGFSIIGK